MVNKYGLTTWDEAGQQPSGKGKRNQKDTDLKLDNGSNVIRILTKPYQFTIHKGYKPNESDKGYGWKVPCSNFDGESCPLCEAGVKTQQRWFIGVIDRKTQMYKVLDIGFGVFKEIKTLNQDEDWGSPETFDVDIKVNKDADPTSYYSVVPKPKKPLSQADLAIKAKVEEEYASQLLDRCRPLTRNAVENRIEGIKKYTNGAGKNGTSTTADNSEDESLSFPAN